MQHTTPTLDDLLARIRQARDRVTEAPAQLKALLEESARVVADFESGHGYSPAQAVPMALAVREMAAQDSAAAMGGLFLRFWLEMPACCWSHAIRHISGILPFAACEPTLNSLPLRHRLLLAHELLRTGTATGRLAGTPQEAWCLSLLEQSPMWSFAELLAFLERLHKARRVLNLQIAECLRNIRTAQQCLALVDAPPRPELAIQAATALCVLEVAPGAGTLIKALLSDDDQRISLLLQAIRTNPPYPVAPDLLRTLVQLAQHPLPAIRKDALFTMVVLNVPNLTTIFLAVLRKFTRERNLFYPALLYLSPEQFSEFLGSMPPKLRQDALGYLLHLFMSGAQDLVSHSLSGATHLVRALPEEASAALRQFVQTCRKNRYIDPRPGSLRTPRAPRKHARQESAAFFGRRRHNPEEAFAQAVARTGRITDLNAQDAWLTEQELSGREITDSNFASASLVNLSFAGCLFRNVSFTEGALVSILFTDCRFEQCDFSGTTLESCEFENCAFKDTDATGADFVRCTFSACSARQMLFTDAHLHSCTLHETWTDECVFWETSFSRVQLTSSHFQTADFTRALFFGCTLRGCTFAECTFSHTHLERSKTEHTLSLAGNYSRCAFRQTLSDEPHLLMSAEHERFNALMELATAIPPAAVPKWCRTADALTEHVLQQVLRFRGVIRSRYRFLRQNSQRTNLVRATLEQRRTDFFILLPLLLQTRLFETRHAPKSRWPLCVISGYAPTHETLQIARNLFGLNPQEETQPETGADAPLTVDAIYTIGSVGSIAMTGDSDIDYWISLDPQTFTPKAAAALSDKLESISRWAQETFGLETTFFVMNRNAIIGNDFGISDKESSGSAQALLLKEEFYRTALKVCGRDLAWWAMPPRVDRTAHAALLEQFASLPFRVGECLVDFGILETIPPEEYFGAALWQIVKAFKNPFKSVMKLGILEAYITSKDDILLCETIKQHIVSGNRSLLKTDPYVTLMRTLQEHYHACGNKESAALLQTAFTAKLHDPTLKAQDNALLMTLRNRALQELYGSGAQLKPQGYQQAKALGDSLNSFFLRSYTALQQQLEAKRIAARISPEDITRLGRKIFAAFAPRKDKVERLPFVNSMGRTIRELMFRKDTTPGKRRKWIAMGLPQGVASRRESFVELKADAEPVRLMVWLVVNGIYHPDMHVEVDMTMSPIAAQDVSALLQGLYEFFPHKLLETDAEETLRSEKVLKAHCAFNFTLRRDTAVHKEVAVTYVTNWGELFCTHIEVEDPVLMAKSPRTFLAKNLPHAVTMDMKLGFLIPYKSRTPRISTV